MAMLTIEVKHPHCKSTNVSKASKPNGTQRYACNNPEVKFKILAMTMNGPGIRDTARVLGVRYGY